MPWTIHRPEKIRFDEKWTPEPYSGCWLWTAGVGRRNYGQFSREDWKNEQAHRTSWRLHRGEIPAGLFVLHRCDTPLCVNPEHLFLGSHDDNMLDMVRKGRADDRRGIRHHMAKLSEADVLAIRNDPRPLKDVAIDYGVAQSIVSRVRNRKIWTHI